MTAFNSAFNSAFGHLPQGEIILEPVAGEGAIGTTPYGDLAEQVPVQEYQTLPIVYPPFHPTDARAIEIFLEPNHYNFIPNCSLRYNSAGWYSSGTLDSDAWVGQSLYIEGADKTYHDPVYVGPLSNPEATEWYSPKRAGPEYTFSVYAKGQDSRIQLSLKGYRPKDFADVAKGMEDQPSAEVHSPLMTVSDEDWERYYVKTTSRLADISGDTSNFSGCWWVVPEITVVEEDLFDSDQPNVRLSSFMLDPSEGVVCDFFDADMAEPGQDDFIWIYDSPPGTAGRKALFSAYYYERQVRSHWMHKHLYEAVPVNRPVHIYYYDRNNPWDDNGPIPFEITSEQHTSSQDGPSLIETAVSQYAGLARALP